MTRLSYPTSRLTVLSVALGACLSSPAWGLTTEEAVGLREGYLETLQILVTEGIEPATESLIEHETAVARKLGARGLEQLREVELELADELARADANRILPLIALHERAHLAYRRQALEANPFHARATVYLQSQLYAEQLKTSGDREIACDLFVSLAGYFQEGSPGPGAVALYVRALQIDPTHRAALLGLATAREQLGRYGNALTLLQRLVETGSADAEVRLRYAMNLDRLGQRGDAVGVFESLTAEAVPDWVQTLAFQQLARIRMDQERFESARTLLARGLARFPGEPGLAVGLAYVEERLGTGLEDALSAEVFSHDAGASALSARYLYARPSHETLDAVRNRLREAAIENLPSLAEALSARSGGP